MCMCKKCGKLLAVSLLVLGLLFLLADLGVWDLWGIQWWTALLLLGGLSMFGSGSCSDCESCCTSDMKPAKKKK